MDLQNADLRWTDLVGVNLQNANLQSTNLQKANLQGANLESAELKDAVLQEANLKGADLSAANLEGTNLQDANLQGANLWGVRNLTISQLKTIIPSSRSSRSEFNYALIDFDHKEDFLSEFSKPEYKSTKDNLVELPIIWVERVQEQYLFDFQGRKYPTKDPIDLALNIRKEGLETVKKKEENPERKKIIENEIISINYALEHLKRFS
ncbi:MAG: pentapeptide repeat-containing protein [Cytophagales bacterium]|nr:pentapeptide repeat-containing protein [Cytophagales bacterium]